MVIWRRLSKLDKSTSLLRLRVPNPSRWQSTHTRPKVHTSRAGSSSSLFLIGSVALGSGLAGYALALRSERNQAPDNVAQALPVPGNKHSYGTPEDFKKAIAELQATFPSEGSVTTDPGALLSHGNSHVDYHPGRPYSVVVFPHSTEDVVKIVKISNKYRMPITAYAGGTSLEGQFRGPSMGGISVDMSEMNKIIAINEADSDLICQPGVGWMEINETLQEKGIPLFFPIDPAPSATIGGIISNGSSGTNAVRYGTARGEWFLNLTVVLPSGEVIKTRSRSRKSSVGFDTTKLFIGAEGTLGIITEVTLRLAPVLPTTVAVAQFDNLRQAAEAVRKVINHGVGVQCAEILDDNFMRATNMHGQSSRKWPEKDSVFFKFQGQSTEALAETRKIVQEIVNDEGCTSFSMADSPEQAEEIWADRKNALYSSLALAPESKPIFTDVCVPVSRLPDLMYDTKNDVVQYNIPFTVVAHAGDGNFHLLLLFKDEAEKAICDKVVKRMVERAIDLDGTCTGEHGVGEEKSKYLNRELGENTVAFMKSVKQAIDPLWLFNPGKLYPEDKDTVTKHR